MSRQRDRPNRMLAPGSRSRGAEDREGAERTQAAQLRIKRRQAIEAKAQQTPVKIVFPLVLCVLPALFVVIVGPGAIQIFNSFINLQS